MANKNDIELIGKSLDGSHEAFGVLVDAYKKALYRHCFAIVRDPYIAEDLVQETFVTAYYKLPSYDSRYAFATWVFKIGTNKCLDWLRRNDKVRLVGDDALQYVASGSASPLLEAQYSELRAAVRELKPEYQAVISLYYWQGQTYTDIAVIMDVPEGTVKGWLSRAKDVLRKELT